MKTKIVILTLFLLVSRAFGAVTFTDDFQSYAIGVLPESTSGKWLPRALPNTNDNNNDLLTRVVADSSNLFGRGTSNQYLRLTDNNNAVPAVTQNVATNPAGFGTSGQLSITFYDPSGDNPTGQGYLLRLGNAAANGSTAFSISIQNGGLYATSGASLTVAVVPFANYKLDAPHLLQIIYNNTGSSIVYANAQTVEANSMAIWVDGFLVASNLSKSGGSSGKGLTTDTALTTVSFNQKSGFTGTLYVDDITADSTISVQPAYTPALFSSNIIYQALQQNPPDWHYVYGVRTHKLNETFALYTLAVESYVAGPAADSVLVPTIIDRLRWVMSGGKEPECQGGLGGWSHGAFAWSLAFIRRNSEIWNQLTSTEQEHADLLMHALAVAANFQMDDDNNYRCTIDGEKNASKTFNPNHVEGYVGVAMAAASYFGVDDLDSFFTSFDFHTFLSQLKAAQYKNVVSAWTYTKNTCAALTHTGPAAPFDPNDPDAGLGVGVKGNAFTYANFRADHSWEIYNRLATRFFSHQAKTEIPITSDGTKDYGTTYIINPDPSGSYLSPFEGQMGMAFEFITTNTEINSSNFRSSLYYVYEGWMNDMASALATYVQGKWPGGPSNAALYNLMKVGTGDFFYKAEYGYHGFANGNYVIAYEADLATTTGGWPWAKAWWTDVISNITIAPAAASVSLGQLEQTYDGTPKTATAATTPAGLDTLLTYAGYSNPPIDAGLYQVVATINAPYYTGSSVGNLVISPASATLSLGNLAQTYDGAQKPITVGTAPATLPFAVTYDGSNIAPTNAGSYSVHAATDSKNYLGFANGTLVVAPAGASLSLGSLNQTYDGTPKAVSVDTVPSGLGVTVSYNGNSTPPSLVGSYLVSASISDHNHTGSVAGTLTITQGTASVTLSGLGQTYDGTPRNVGLATDPADLDVTVTYNGSPTAPTQPDSYAVTATVNDPRYTGSAQGTLVIGSAAIVRHAPSLNGTLSGSLQVLTGEAFSLNSGAHLSGDLLVPGLPTVTLNGAPSYSGTVDAGGAVTPSGYSICLNAGTVLSHIVRRTDPVSMPSVAAPPSPTGTTVCTINTAGQSAGDFATLRDLTLNSNVGGYSVPVGSYGNFVANSGSGFVLGVPGSTTPLIYTFQHLTLNSGALLQVVGPVIISLANGVILNAAIGTASHPDWLVLNLSADGLTLNSGATVYGQVIAPNGTVTINGNAQLVGKIACDRLTINSGGVLSP